MLLDALVSDIAFLVRVLPLSPILRVTSRWLMPLSVLLLASVILLPLLVPLAAGLFLLLLISAIFYPFTDVFQPTAFNKKRRISTVKLYH